MSAIPVPAAGTERARRMRLRLHARR